jgi:hypothetical protein
MEISAHVHIRDNLTSGQDRCYHFAGTSVRLDDLERREEGEGNHLI